MIKIDGWELLEICKYSIEYDGIRFDCDNTTDNSNIDTYGISVYSAEFFPFFNHADYLLNYKLEVSVMKDGRICIMFYKNKNNTASKIWKLHLKDTDITNPCTFCNSLMDYINK